MDQKPTIGRIVHYWVLNSEECQETPNPAVVTRVLADGSVDLHVLGDLPRPLAHNADVPDPMRRGVFEGNSGGAGTWCWPPRA